MDLEKEDIIALKLHGDVEFVKQNEHIQFDFRQRDLTIDALDKIN